MKNKEMIEEMAKVISGSTEIDTMSYYKALNKAKELYAQNYRKIPKDSVVLTRERYEYLTRSFENFDKIMEDVKKLERKETAREIFSKLLSKDMIEREEWSEDNYKVVYENVDADDIRELAKQYGVEIKE